MKKISIVIISTILLALATHSSAVRAQPVASITMPPPGGTVQLYQGCNNIPLSFPDGTPSETVTGAVTPAGLVGAMWQHNAAMSKWEGFSPEAAQASDLRTVDFFIAVWLCVAGAPPAAPPPPAPIPPSPVPPTSVLPLPTAVPPAPIPPTATPSPSAETTYVGTHSGGGTVRLTVYGDGTYVNFEAKGFCAPDDVLSVPFLRIDNFAFYWERPFRDTYRHVSGTLLPSGEAYGTLSYHTIWGCHRDWLTWAAYAQ